MKTLFISTVTEHLMIGLYEGNALMDSFQMEAKGKEAELLLPSVEKLLAKHSGEIDRGAVCIGPGGFTSARIGVSAANTLAFAKRIPLAEVTVFDLFPTDQTIVIPVNPHEAWIKEPGKNPRFITKESKGFPGNAPAQFPNLEHLHFEHRLAKPWYYKDANITWSKRIHL